MKELQELQDSLQEMYIQEQTSKDEYNFVIETSNLSPEDREVLQEMYFSKKDLQDPESLKKIKEKLEKREPIFDTLAVLSGFLLLILGTIISCITAGIFTLITFPFITVACVYIGLYIKDIPYNQFKKDNEKFKKKVIKLKEKTQEKLDKETDNSKKIEYKKIIDNCDKVLKVIEKREKEKADEAFKKRVKDIKNDYDYAIKILENPDTMIISINYWDWSTIFTIM